MQQLVSVRALIHKADKLLLLRRSQTNKDFVGFYELPGGKVHFGEKPKEAVIREVQEEIGCKVEAIQLVDTVAAVSNSNPDVHLIILVFELSIATGVDIVISPEHDKYEWVSMSDIQQFSLTEITQSALGIASPNPIISDDKKTMTKQAIVYSDGGSRGNPGPSAAGFVVKDDQEQTVFEGGKYLGITTNNQAEYHAIRLGLEKAYELGAREVMLRLDSLLAANQLKGIYQVKNRDLWPIHATIKQLMTQFEAVSIMHVRREFNKEADAMVNKILDEHQQ